MPRQRFLRQDSQTQISRGGGAYVNGRYVSASELNKGKGKGRGDGGGEKQGWGDDTAWERKPGDEDVGLETKFDIDILQPGESRVGYLFNLKQTRHYDEGGRTLSGFVLYFLQRDGCTFRCSFLYRPYMFVQVDNNLGLEQMKDILLAKYQREGVTAELVEKEDLAMENHIVGNKRKLIKLTFDNENGQQRARRDLFAQMRNSRKADNFSSFDANMGKKKEGASVATVVELYEHDVPYVCRVCIDNDINCGKWFDVSRNLLATSVDNIWDTQCTVKALNEMTKPPGLRIFAWDIECTKAPLKFPDSAYDRVTMISIMADGMGYLIVNRTEVSADIEPLEYTPKPEYEGKFETFNEPDEASLLRRFFQLIRDINPHVMVSFNGDFFDHPFIDARAKAYSMDVSAECGIKKYDQQDYFCGQWIVHLDCFNWVQRDSYLPCGARGLKAVTKYKLKYDPVELDPEVMTPYAKERPQELAAYSVSDAVATYYLYMKYIHDFIFALCSIIPYGPDDVLRRGSGTLCEALLMNQAFKANVVFPNKHHDEPIEYHEQTNRLIETSSYEGARVECMRVGVYRSDISETFQLEPSAFEKLINDVKVTCDFFLTVESSTKIEDVENYQEILDEVTNQLKALCDPQKVQAQLGRGNRDPQPDDYTLKLVEYLVVEGDGGVKSGGKKVKKSSYRVIKEDFPFIYHLDVGAMYPNIILSNRLQPSAMVTREFCAACEYDDPSNNCKRYMDWMWRADLFMCTRADVKSIINEMENDKRRYSQKDRDSGEMKRVGWKELSGLDQTKEILKAAREFSQKAYRRVKSSINEKKNDIICQRENPFYVNTVLNFRDRRYTFKRATKAWNGKLEKANQAGDLEAIMEAKGMVLLNDSLQLAHKCILNSFYGYVMRKGARWHSMKMAGITTYTGSNLIREAREFCEMVGLPIELDTDGIWCMLPKKFPDVFKFKTKAGKELKLEYPNSVLNYRVHAKYTNHQYQDQDAVTKEWKTRSENSIFFEIDGPYKCMVLPASTEEDKMLKKRYAVFEEDGSLAELKGFELKRRGELKLIQVFQEEVFPVFLNGTTKQECWDAVGACANRWLDVIESKGRTMTDDEVVYFFSENKNMSKSVEASGSYKSVQITTAKRLSDFLGLKSFLTDGGISCHLFIANKPVHLSTTERAVPVKIFGAEEETKKKWLREWLQDSSLQDFDMRSIIDWDYYKQRFEAVILKLICIPCAYQKFINPVPRAKIPDWLQKRVNEENDRFQQQSLGLWLRKVGDGGNGGAGNDAAKRKLGDLEDLADGAPKKSVTNVTNLPVVEFGKGPKKWLETQRLRWAAGADGAWEGAGSQRTAWKSSLFDDGAAWSHIATEAMRANWHIVAIEPASAVRGPATSFKLGEKVLVQIEEGIEEEVGEQQRGTIVGFAGGLIKVSLEFGGEQLCAKEKVTAIKDGGLFVIWVATGNNHSLHRCEVVAQRRVTLGLESEYTPDSNRFLVKPRDLVKGLRVWPRSDSATDKIHDRVGPGIVTSAEPSIGLCGVTWAKGGSEAVFAHELERTGGNVARVYSDPPRNIRHTCLVQKSLDDTEFQNLLAEGALGDQEAGFPRIEAIYEAEQSLEFDLMCRLGSSVKVAEPDKVEEGRGKTVRLKPEDLVEVSHKEYLKGLTPSRNVYIQLCFDKLRPSRAFCGVFSPGLSEAWMCFSGLDRAASETMKPEFEQFVSEQLTSALQGASITSLPLGTVRTEASFLSKASLGGVLQWLEQKLADVRRIDGTCVYVLCSQIGISELRGVTPSSWVEQRYLRGLSSLREMPVCSAFFPASDSNFPTLDWPLWICRTFSARVPQLLQWWQERLAVCRAVGIPVCNLQLTLGETPAAMAPAALDYLFARQLRKDSQVVWASSRCRPDLGESPQALVDAQEGSIDVMTSVLKGSDLQAGRAGGQINEPGIYRSVCMEVDLRTKLCICALQYAKYLSEREGGELSKKMVRKVDGLGKNTDHTSEVSITSFESLVTMVNGISEVRDAKTKEIAVLRQRWAATAEVTNDFPVDEDSEFVAAMENAGFPDPSLAAKIEELRTEELARNKLLDSLYGWLASPTSLMYDPALLRKVHTYMDKVLHVFIAKLHQTGCSVIYASYGKVLFATGKHRVVPDTENFFATLCDAVNSEKVLLPLDLQDPSKLYYGVMWLDPANYGAVPIDMDTGSIIWKARSSWKIAEFLPPAVRPNLLLYAGELLLTPQRYLESKVCQSLLGGLDEAPADAPDEEMPCANEDGGSDGEEGAMEVDAVDKCEAKDPVDDAAAKEKPEKTAASDTTSLLKTTELMDEVRDYVRGEFFTDLKRRILIYIDDLQTQQQLELPGGLSGDTVHAHQSESEGSDDEDGARADERKAARTRRHLEQKWSFPAMPGRRVPPKSLDLEFMKALVQMFNLEECLGEQIYGLRERICQKLKISSFGQGIAFENPCFPLIIRDLVCPWCCATAHVDITSHPTRESSGRRLPGQWICTHCKKTYDKDAVQARLVDLLETVIQAWQSQEITCRKCHRLQTSLMQNHCECFGLFQARFKNDDFKLVLRILRSLVVPHELPWLGEMLDIYEPLV